VSIQKDRKNSGVKHALSKFNTSYSLIINLIRFSYIQHAQLHDGFRYANFISTLETKLFTLDRVSVIITHTHTHKHTAQG